MIKVISFDLDNTLYDNSPVITLAEKSSREFLEQEFKKQNKNFNIEDFLKSRNRLIKSNPLKYENLSLLRIDVLKFSCKNLENSNSIVEQAFNLFIENRQQVEIPQPIQEMLITLSKNFKLITITNGNCNAEKLLINDLFSQHYSPQLKFRAKPHPQMFEQAIQDFSINKNELLHVGDEIKTDGQAAEIVGCKFHHFLPFKDPLNLQKSIQILLALV